MKSIGWLSFFAVLLCVPLAAQAPRASCVMNAAVPPIIRAEGTAERVGDLVLQCTGGVPTPAGQPFPKIDLTLFLDVTITNKLTAAGFTETLLIMDEPISFVRPTTPVLNCGNIGAPDNSAAGPGVCSILSKGDPVLSYDGTPSAYGTALCDGSGGRPSPGSYGCGRPNVFQAQPGSQTNSIVFRGVPFDPPGDGTTRTLRIANLRANASEVQPSPIPFYTPTTSATVSITGTGAPSITNPQEVVGYVQRAFANCPASSPTRVRICEGHASALRAKSVAFAVGDRSGTPGNAPYSAQVGYSSYNGGLNYPIDSAQNVAGAIYNAENGYSWQDNGVHAPPAPNPPLGYGIIAVMSPGSAPLFSAGSGGVFTGISNSGIADSGTRIALQFTGIPAGATVQVPPRVYLSRQNPSGIVADPLVFQSGVSLGVLVRTAADAAGNGPFAPIDTSLTAASSIAVYEVLWADPFSLEWTEFPYVLLNAPPETVVQVTSLLAPVYSEAASKQASLTYPVPRFVSPFETCGGVPCLTASPNRGANTGLIDIQLTYLGNRTLTGSSVVLRREGLADIPGAPYAYPAQNVISATFDLAGAATGQRDAIISLTNGFVLTVPNVFTVEAPAGCSYGLATAPNFGYAFPMNGGTASVAVTPAPASCNWGASTNVSWITLLPKVPGTPGLQPFSVAPNPTGVARTGSISIAGVERTVTQAGVACVFTLDPASASVNAGGGSWFFSVTAPVGCEWNPISNVPWLTLAVPGARMGTSQLTYYFAENPTTVARSGTFTFAGRTFTVNQGPAQPPKLLAFMPGTGSGSEVPYTFGFGLIDQRGVASLGVVNILINNFLDGRRACYLAYSRPFNVLYLVNDNGDGLLPGQVLNGPGSLSNSQCNVRWTAGVVTVQGPFVQLALEFTFNPGFAGNKIVYVASRDVYENTSGWHAAGTWEVPGTTPGVISIQEMSVVGFPGPAPMFTFNFRDTRGSADLGVINILVNDFLDGRRACYLAYSRPFNILYLVNDAGDGLLPGAVLNSPGSLANSQCTVSWGASPVVANGTALALSLNMSFTNSFAGNRIFYLAARDVNEGSNTDWQAKFPWTVQ